MPDVCLKELPMRLDLTKVDAQAVPHVTRSQIDTFKSRHRQPRWPIEVLDLAPLPYNPHSPGHPRLRSRAGIT